MKLSKKITLSCLLFSIALLLGGCSWLPSNQFSKESSNETANKKTDLEALEDVKKNYIEKLKADLLELEKKTDAEKSKCDDMTQQTLKDGKNPKDAKDAPKTIAQCQNAESAEMQVKETKETLAKTEKDLSEIQKQKSQLPTSNSDSTDSSWLTWWLIGTVGLVGLGILLSALYMLLSKKIDKAIAEERTLNQQSFARIRDKHNRMTELEKTIKLQQGKINVLEVTLKENTIDYPSVNVLESKLREKDNDFKEMVDEIIQTVRLQQGKIEELEFKMKKGDERTK